ncbi:MAG: HAD-IA family hydrolase [Actinomycetota bacterium]|nr:HAD-IA family hydrolase [Euzebyaceae bacterium]MDQ3453510.1 HAD-IA family hydrolase [Actinomycetota bacterium]
MTAVGPPDGVLFDAGGTLVQVHTERLAEALRQHGHDPADLDDSFWRTLVLLDHEFAPTAGTWDDWFPHWLTSFGQRCGVPAEVMAQAWRAADRDLHLWDRAINGAAECLTRLREAGIRVGVVSNSDGRVEAALDRAGLAELLEVVVDSGVVGVAKPDPAIFAYALGPLGLQAERTWYLGDTVAYDVVAADAAGLTSWVVDHHGLHTVEHPRRVQTLAEFADAALAARGLRFS